VENWSLWCGLLLFPAGASISQDTCPSAQQSPELSVIARREINVYAAEPLGIRSAFTSAYWWTN
jgi:hypothetical protein